MPAASRTKVQLERLTAITLSVWEGRALRCVLGWRSTVSGLLASDRFVTLLIQ